MAVYNNGYFRSTGFTHKPAQTESGYFESCGREKLGGQMIIEAHQHSFWLGQNDADLVTNMNANGIDLAWLLTLEIPSFEHTSKHHRQLNPANVRADGTHAGITLDDQVLTRDRYPDRFILGYCSHPALDGAADRLEQAYDMYGARVCGEWRFCVPLDEPRCLSLFRIAGKPAMPVLVHIDVPYLPGANGKLIYQPLWYGGTVVNLEGALKACPATIVLGHGPGFGREISGDADRAPASRPVGPVVPDGRVIRLLEKYANLYGELSATSALNALRHDLQNAKDFLACFAERLLFGRDCFSSDLHEFLQSHDLSDHIARHTYSENAQCLVPKG